MYVGGKAKIFVLIPKLKIDLFFEFVRFCVIGAVFAAFNVCLLWLFVNTFKLHYLASTLIAFVLLNWISYWFNKVIAFQMESKFVAQELLRYYAVLSLNLAINLTGMWIAVDIWGVYFLTASVGLTVVLAFLNFASHKIWTFRQVTSKK